MVLLSGPEPQRTFLENKLRTELKNYKGTVVFIKGKVEPEQNIKKDEKMTVYNYMTTSDLEKALNESRLILSRSGYTTIMDLYKLNKKCFFIPTPGQYEQLYLAKKLKEDLIAPFCFQDDFTIEKLDEVKEFNGFQNGESYPNFQDLFSLFKGK